MTTPTRYSNNDQATGISVSSKPSQLISKVRYGVWLFGIFSWMFAVTERCLACFADGALSAPELIPISLVFSLCIVWVHLKPRHSEAESSPIENISTLKYYKIDSGTPQHETYRHKTEARMLQLEKYHLITQEYILPIPYLCQIYHLLNLKHLESVHGFSLNNLKVTDVSQFKATASGGIIKFQTVLDSSLNVLKVLRQPIVEVALVLHTPYTIELNVPVYSGKKIAVIFNVLPLSNNEHKLFIDIYSNLPLPKPLLQILLHVASSLTLFEDLPYLSKLAQSNLNHSSKWGKSDHKAMQLFNRFVELYGSSLQQPPAMGAVKLQPISSSS
ncbi:MAG: hypothetical protein KME11_13050 [Timaviella obliquedivisa GSE-PSE-MK23-08B]|jgi:hypothetical protein|nr:hypothetical protein [Timaviella obliquedivisa GSE-PSE-MK23-08B]